MKLPRKVYSAITLDRATAAHARLLDRFDPAGSTVMAFLESHGLAMSTVMAFNLMASSLGAGMNERPRLGIPWRDSGRVTMVRQFSITPGEPDAEGVTPDWRAIRQVTKGNSRYRGMFNVEAVRGQKTVVLCGDEFDCMAIHQAIAETKYMHPPVAAVIDAHASITNELSESLVSAEQIVLWFDDNPQGNLATTNLIQRLGSHRCKVASIPQDTIDLCMDMYESTPVSAQDLMRMAVGRQDILAILKAAEPVGETASVRPSHYREQIRARIYGGTAALGYPFKWPGLQKLLRGLRKRELIYLTAHDKHGKTTTMTALAESFAEQDIPVAICCLEGSGPQGVADVQHQRKVGKPLSSLNSDAERQAAELVIDDLDTIPLHIINLSGTQKFATVADHVRNAVKRHGCLILFMDHLHQITADNDHGERNIEAHINKTVHAFADLAKELDIPIVLAGHPASNVEEDQVPTASSVKGGSSVKQVVDASISLWRPRRVGTKFKDRSITLKPVGGYEFKVEMSSTNVVFLVTTVRHREASTGHFMMNFHRDSQAYSEIIATKPDGQPLDDSPQPKWAAMAPTHAEVTHVED